MRRKRLLKAACLVSPLAALAVAAPGFAAPADFSCRASAARISVLGLNIEPFVANAGDIPCATDGTGLLRPVTIPALLPPLLGEIDLAILNADTARVEAGTDSSTAAAAADARVLDLTLRVLGNTISVRLLNSQAAFTCENGPPVP